MRLKQKLLLTLFTFFLLAPILSFSIRTALAEDSISDTIDSTAYDFKSRPLVFELVIDGAIGTVTDDRIKGAIEDARAEGAVLIVITLDTPGGFTKPTWSICKSFLNSPIPICVYIAPSGARAGSAGVYMTYAAHFAAMAPSTNIGAAHPVSGDGKEIDSVMNEKITNDAVAQIKAAAEKRGRNAEWAEKAVRESVSITDREALEMNVIDFRAETIDSLLAVLDGREVDLPQGKTTLHLKNARVKQVEKSFVWTILEIITDPEIAFILFSMGGLGIVLELYNPGAIFPGVVGAISLILAFYAFQTLPINYAGVALIVLGIILFIAEVKVISHGILTIGGLVSIFFGGLMLVDTVDPDLRISKSFLFTVVIAIGIVVGLVGWLVVRAAKNKPFIGREGLVGKHAEVRTNGQVYVDGALWKAECDTPLAQGDKVEIVAVDSLTLKVKKL
jgi:membrane-bound serine protease (ClpP class)